MALKCRSRARGVNRRPSYIIQEYFAILGALVRLYAFAAATPAEVYTGTQLAKAFSDPSVADVILQNDIYWKDSDWDGIPNPIRLTYNFRVRGRDDSVLSDGTPNTTLDFGFIARKVQLADSVTLELSRLITTNYRIGNHNQAPGLDLLLPSTDGAVSILRISDSIIVHRACYPVRLQPQSFAAIQRPSILGGEQQGATTAPAPVNCASSNASAATRPPGCFEHYGVYTDFGVPGAEVDKYGKVYPSGIIVHMLRSLYGCGLVMTEECIRDKGITGCAFYTFSKLQPPAPSLASGSFPGSGSGSAHGPETGALKVEGAPPTEVEPAGRNSSGAVGRFSDAGAGDGGDGGGGGGGGGGDGSSKLGLALGASLGGAALLSAVALFSVLARRRWRRGPSQPRDGCCTAPVGGGTFDISSLPCCSKVEGDMLGQPRAVGDRPRTSNPEGDGLRNSGGSPLSDVNPYDPECGKAQDLVQESDGPCILGLEPSTTAMAARSVAPSSPKAGGACAGAAGAVLLHLAAPAGAAACEDGWDGTRAPPCQAAGGAGGCWGARRPNAFFFGRRRSKPAEVEAPPDGQPKPITAAGKGAVGQQVYGRRLEPVAEAAAEAEAMDAVDPLVVVTPFTPHRPDLNLRLRQPITAGAGAPEEGGGGAHGDGGGGGCEVELLPNAIRGRGSFGRVVEGIYRGERVAVKLMADLTGRVVSENSLTRSFAQEVEVLGRCQHPNVVRLLAACLTPPRLCLVMELMDTTLDSMMRRAPGCLLPMDTVLSICLDIARGLEYLHPTIIHRDLKPANVLINDPHGPRQITKLTDFGLSRLRSSVLLTKNPEAGTPPYMAPECFDALNASLSHQVDMYSFGVVLWVMLSGKEPWPGLNMVRLAYLVTVAGKRLPLNAIPVDRRPRKLLRLIAQCWEADPWRRPAAAEAVKVVLLVKEMMARGAAGEEDPKHIGSPRSTELPQQKQPQGSSPRPPPPLSSLQQEGQQQQQQDRPQLPLPKPLHIRQITWVGSSTGTGSNAWQGNWPRALDEVALSMGHLQTSASTSASDDVSLPSSELRP